MNKLGPHSPPNCFYGPFLAQIAGDGPLQPSLSQRNSLLNPENPEAMFQLLSRSLGFTMYRAAVAAVASSALRFCLFLRLYLSCPFPFIRVFSFLIFSTLVLPCVDQAIVLPEAGRLLPHLFPLWINIFFFWYLFNVGRRGMPGGLGAVYFFMLGATSQRTSILGLGLGRQCFRELTSLLKPSRLPWAPRWVEIPFCRRFMLLCQWNF